MQPSLIHRGRWEVRMRHEIQNRSLPCTDVTAKVLCARDAAPYRTYPGML